MFCLESPYIDYFDNYKPKKDMSVYENDDFAVLTINDKEVAAVIKKQGEYVLYNTDLITPKRVQTICDFLLEHGVQRIDGGRILMESLLVSAKNIECVFPYGKYFLYDKKEKNHTPYELTHDVHGNSYE